MLELNRKSDLARSRRMALGAQGLLQARPFGQGLPGARKAIKHIGYVQVDSISVIERAHHHVLYSRVPGYRPDMIDRMLLAGDIFEYWTHAAAFMPMSDYRFSLPYKHAVRNGKIHWYKDPDRKLMGDLLARIREDGPLRSRDLESPDRKRAGWWEWKPAKKAIEQLYMEGDLMVSAREGFQKTYDLAERVLPADVDTSVPSIEEFAAHLLEQQLRCHGLVSLKGLTYQRRSARLRNAVRERVNTGLAEGQLEQVRIRGDEIFLIEAGAMDQHPARLSKRLSILSPFDNSVIQRDRLKALFGFDYQLECYVPEAKREYGYFSLPLLYRGEFIGRMDCKAHRKSGQLEVRNLHFEGQPSDKDALIAAFVDAIGKFCKFQGCQTVTLTRVTPPGLATPIRREIDL